MWLYIPLIVIGFCVAVIFFIIVRKFPNLSNIDLTSVPKEREAQIKDKIIMTRFSRKTAEHINSFVKMVLPLWKAGQAGFRKLYQQVFDLEKKYRKKYQPLVSKKELHQNIGELLKQAESLVVQEKFASAEKQFIEVIALDNKNFLAYEGLAQLYLSQKEYEKAKEILEYMLKLNSHERKLSETLAGISKEKGNLEESLKEEQKQQALDKIKGGIYLNLGEVSRALDQNEAALDAFLKASEIEPHHPKYLDLLLDTAIILGKKQLAMETFENLKNVNPDNKKLDEWMGKIKGL